MEDWLLANRPHWDLCPPEMAQAWQRERWAHGFGWITALREALETVFQLPRREQPSFVKQLFLGDIAEAP